MPRVKSASFYQGEEPDDLLLFVIAARKASDGGNLVSPTPSVVHLSRRVSDDA
jgi:hypothetical protein